MEHYYCLAATHKPIFQNMTYQIPLTTARPGNTYSGKMLASLQGTDLTSSKQLVTVCIALTRTRGNGSRTR